MARDIAQPGRTLLWAGGRKSFLWKFFRRQAQFCYFARGRGSGHKQKLQNKLGEQSKPEKIIMQDITNGT